MEIPQLNKVSIFAIPAGDHFEIENEHCFMIYSPLSESIIIASPEDLQKIEDSIGNYLKGDNYLIDEEINELLQSLLDFSVEPDKIKGVNSPLEYNKLSIIPNYKCNFSCSYCYSAAGRSNKEIDIGKIKATLDLFIDAERANGKDLKIFVSGGGEPLLSWKTLRDGLEYAYNSAAKQNLILRTQIMTNGSVITSEMVEFFRKYNISICISFEILEDIQNMHRGSYSKVVNNISKLITNGVIPSISATITRESVHLQKEMFEHMLSLFPKIKGINYDPVLAPELFDTVDELKKYFDDFIFYFLKARREIGTKYHIAPHCSMINLIENKSIRYCPGKLSLTPESTFSICHSVTSPQEDGYADFIYGEISNENKIVFNHEKFTGLINRNVFERPECDSCFAKWHCAGGCIMQNNKYKDEMHQISCEFTRKFIKLLLLERLEDEYAITNGKSLKSVIQELCRSNITY